MQNDLFNVVYFFTYPGIGVSQMLIIADKGGGLKFFHQRDFMGTKMWIERAIDYDFTIHGIVKPYNMQIGP